MIMQKYKSKNEQFKLSIKYAKTQKTSTMILFHDIYFKINL